MAIGGLKRLECGWSERGDTYVKPVERFMPARMVETARRLDAARVVGKERNVLRTASKA
jgi:hypothetical protein